MESLGDIIRRMRKEKGLPLRTVAAYLDIDQAILSKMERGQRNTSREMVIKLAKYFELNEDELLVAWLSDKLIYELADEQLGLKALQMAEAKVNYNTQNIALTPAERLNINSLIHQYFISQDLVSKAWLFGSYARGDDSAMSDIDVLIDVPIEKKFTLFDIAEVQEQLQSKLNKVVDVVMLNGLRPEVKERIKKDMLLIYEA